MARANANVETSAGVEPSGSVTASRGIKLVGETLAPGTSLLLDGNVGPGAVHLVGGWIARKALGPVGWLLVAANSYSQSVTGRSLMDHLQGQMRGNRPD
jgi:hypothetical protein